MNITKEIFKSIDEGKISGLIDTDLGKIVWHYEFFLRWEALPLNCPGLEFPFDRDCIQGDKIRSNIETFKQSVQT